MDLIPPTTPILDPSQPLSPVNNLSFNLVYTPTLIAFLQRTGLGFVRDVRDRLATDDLPEGDNLNIGQ